MQFTRPKLGSKCLQSGIQNILISLLLIGNSTAIFADSYAPVLQASLPAAHLTLKDALNLALNANPEIAVAIREREAIEGIKTQAATRPNPSLSTSIQDTRSSNRQTLLQLNQEIELGNKREARIEAADSFYTKAEAELDNKKTEIHANVIAAFYTVLIAQERLTLAKSSLDIAELARDAASKRVKAGKSSPVEETKSKIAEASAKIEFNQANTQLTNSRKRLAALWGSALHTFENAEGDATVIPEMAAFSTLASQLDNAPAIKLANIEIDSRSALTKIERSKGTPNITISAGVVNNQELGGVNQALLGLSIPIPIFDRNQGNLQEAVSRQYKAQDELVALKNQLAANLSGQYERLNTARQAAESLKTDILPSAQSAFDAANKGFSAGKFNFLDVLDAQRTLVQAKSQYIETLLDAHQAVAEIERILGDVISHHNQY
ncbi:TolC family protein [Methylotenera versatilis]|uniref:TolC family protein n=1 Tax=Methylotenera versatilis TaxID=1055487 RepID=UPI000645CB2A|nr:TolC family protein [Methylotenera versatilis]